jgi:Ser/Thr protein kinase RdoA (MazF antagonist)
MRLTRPQEAQQVGWALGHFHQLCRALSPNDFYDTLPGFHITLEYYHAYCQQLEQPPTITEDDDSRYCRAFIDGYATKVSVLEDARQRGELQLRIIHGDPKLDNFLFLPDSDTVISLIDLDTLKPGLLHYDIGDCIRSCCQQADSPYFQLEQAQRLLQHYVQATSDLLSDADFAYLYPAIELIPFELGLRFFSDYLAGNRYFKVDHPRHNLQRAVAQFQLCQAISRHEPALQALISRLQLAR